MVAGKRGKPPRRPSDAEVSADVDGLDVDGLDEDQLNCKVEEFKSITSIFCNEIGLDDGAIKDLLNKHYCDTGLAAQEAINEFHDKRDKKYQTT